MVVNELVQLESEEVFSTITSLLIADVDKTKLAALFSDCADAANKIGNRENERMFLLAELVTSGTFPTNANVEEIRSKANMLLALHEQQKSLPKIVESAFKLESAAPDAKSSAEPVTVVPDPEPEVKASESPVVTAAPEVTPEESSAAPLAPSAEAVAEPPPATPEPQVRRRTRKKK